MREIALISCPGIGSPEDCLGLARSFTSARSDVHVSIFLALSKRRTKSFEAISENKYLIRLTEEPVQTCAGLSLRRTNLQQPEMPAITTDDDEPKTAATSTSDEMDVDESHTTFKRSKLSTAGPEGDAAFLDILSAVKILKISSQIDLVVLEMYDADDQRLLEIYYEVECILGKGDGSHTTGGGCSRRMTMYYRRRVAHDMSAAEYDEPVDPGSEHTPTGLSLAELPQLESPSVIIGEIALSADVPMAKYFKCPAWSFYPNGNFLTCFKDTIADQSGWEDVQSKDGYVGRQVISHHIKLIERRAGVIHWTKPTTHGITKVPASLSSFRRALHLDVKNTIRQVKEFENQVYELIYHNVPADKFSKEVVEVFEAAGAQPSGDRKILWIDENNLLPSMDSLGDLGKIAVRTEIRPLTARATSDCVTNCKSLLDVLSHDAVTANPENPLQLENAQFARKFLVSNKFECNFGCRDQAISGGQPVDTILNELLPKVISGCSN